MSSNTEIPKDKRDQVDSIGIHPLVLLSVVDHYDRVAKDTKKRVVGCLLGEKSKGVVNISNSFAVPFDEEVRPPKTWFLDYNYLEDMFRMFRRVNAREKIVGWYSSGPKIRNNDKDIQRLFNKYCTSPVYLIIRVNDKVDGGGLPVDGYASINVVRDDGRNDHEFSHRPVEIVSTDAEEVGVEHLLRNIQDDTQLSTITNEVGHKITGLRSLIGKLEQIESYLNDVVNKSLPINQDILQSLQLMFNLMPNLSKQRVVKAFSTNANDQILAIYMASVMRSVLALDKLIDNKLENKAREKRLEDAARRREKKAEEAEKKKAEDAQKEKEKGEGEKKEADEQQSTDAK